MQGLLRGSPPDAEQYGERYIERAKARWSSEEHTEAQALRQRTAKMQSTVVEGV